MLLRHFTDAELISIIEFFEKSYPEVATARLAAQVFFWSCARRKEISSLKWDSLRLVGDEVHFDVVGKWMIRKWFRVPSKLYEELLSIKTSSPPETIDPLRAAMDMALAREDWLEVKRLGQELHLQDQAS